MNGMLNLMICFWVPDWGSFCFLFCFFDSDASLQHNAESSNYITSSHNSPYSLPEVNIRQSSLKPTTLSYISASNSSNIPFAVMRFITRLWSWDILPCWFYMSSEASVVLAGIQKLLIHGVATNVSISRMRWVHIDLY